MAKKKITKQKNSVCDDMLMSFDDVLKACKKPHLLLGNGFSVAYNSERFSFTSLLESAVENNIIQNESAAYEIFQKLATADFESVMRALENADKIVEVYGGCSDVREKIKQDISNIKEYLVQVITNNHPEKSTDLSEEEKVSCLSFIEPFSNIYTLNYDLLLYWATMHDQSKVSDGFGNTQYSECEGYVVYMNSGKSPRVKYLHGALHYFDAGSEIIKKTYINSEIPLVEQTRSSLADNVYPIFISEGTSEQKKTKIMHNVYLAHCYKSLRCIGGDLVIFGSSLKSNDEHIMDAILQSKVKYIYFGVSCVDGGQHIIDIVEKHNKSAEEKYHKNVILYDYRTVNVWGK